MTATNLHRWRAVLSGSVVVVPLIVGFDVLTFGEVSEPGTINSVRARTDLGLVEAVSGVEKVNVSGLRRS